METHVLHELLRRKVWAEALVKTSSTVDADELLRKFDIKFPAPVQSEETLINKRRY